MSRRPHKKSRNGCLECKRRHIRCDGNYPICANCGAAEKQCSFHSNDSPYVVPAFSNGHSPGTASSNILLGLSTPASMSYQEALDPYSVNMIHLELFNNLFSKEFLSIEESEHLDKIPTTTYIKYALTTPYLMHQVLASSALHLSTRTAKSRSFYHQYATSLQTRALSLFHENNLVLEVTATNCIQMFLFSSVVGVHLLCDKLYHQRDGLEEFINGFTHGISIYRGVLVINDQCRHLLLETELGPLLKSSQGLMQSMDTSGLECDALHNLVDAADGTPSLRHAYRESVQYLQQVFDAQRAAPGGKTRLSLILKWPVLISPDYIELLRQRKSEALIILAHYAVLLHRGRDLWLFGDGGEFIIKSICESLGSNWQGWLKFPKAALSEDLTA